MEMSAAVSLSFKFFGGRRKVQVKIAENITCSALSTADIQEIRDNAILETTKSHGASQLTQLRRG